MCTTTALYRWCIFSLVFIGVPIHYLISYYIAYTQSYSSMYFYMLFMSPTLVVITHAVAFELFYYYGNRKFRIIMWWFSFLLMSTIINLPLFLTLDSETKRMYLSGVISLLYIFVGPFIMSFYHSVEDDDGNPHFQVTHRPFPDFLDAEYI